MRLISDMVAYAVRAIPKWNPTNVCSYHLQEAGATPVQELAFALANAICVLDTVRDSGAVPPEEFPQVVGRISFFVNAGVRFIEEVCKLRAFTEIWDEITRDRYGVRTRSSAASATACRSTRSGSPRRSPRTTSSGSCSRCSPWCCRRKPARRSVQLPAWNEALGLPRPWDQQWSLRIQQVLAFETDLLEYEDLFDGSRVIEARTEELKAATREELARVEKMGGALAAVESAYFKQSLVASNAARVRRIESGEQIVVGVNKFVEAEPSPLAGGIDRILKVDPAAEREQIERLQAFRRKRNAAEVEAALANLRDALKSGSNVMPPSIRCASAGVTTGEWADTLREVFGEYRAPTGVSGAATTGLELDRLTQVRAKLAATEKAVGHKLRMLVGKPGLDGHSNGAEQIALAARDVGFEVIYDGIRNTPETIARVAADEDVDVIGLSILSGSHLELVPETLRLIRELKGGDVPVVVGGIIPEEDRAPLLAAGVARVYTPKDFELGAIMDDIVDVVRDAHRAVG